MSGERDEANIADLLVAVTERKDVEYALRVSEAYEAIEVVYSAAVSPAVPVGLAASANPRV